MEAQSYLQAYYESHDENARLLTRHGQVEFLTTMRYIERYLCPGARILEVGAGTGRYSHALARMGYRVDAVELIEHNISIFREHAQPGEDVHITQGSATDLSAFESSFYDLTLVLGPLYHLFTQEDKLQALSEAVRVTKPGGVIFAAYCMADPSIVGYGFVRGGIHTLMENHMLDPETFDAVSHPWDIFELHRKEHIDALRSHFDVEQLRFVAADGYAPHMKATVDAMDDETFALYLRYHFATCERQDLIGYSNHTLDIFRRKR